MPDSIAHTFLMGHYSVSVLFSPPLVDLPKMGYNLARPGSTAPASQKSNSATTLTSSKAVILFIQLKDILLEL